MAGRVRRGQEKKEGGKRKEEGEGGKEKHPRIYF